MKEKLKILGLQMKLELASDCNYEYLIETDDYQLQMEHSLELAQKLDPDIIIYPEMCFCDRYEDSLKKMSDNKLIIAGSQYLDHINTTIVFQNKERIEIPKQYASGAEPMIRYKDNLKPRDFLKDYLGDHTFEVNGKKIIVLNCMEYYHAAYYIAREYDDIFALISICSNNNPNVFIEETKAIHNHKENLYSFIVNCVSNYNHLSYGKGQSYIYGPIQAHEKDWLEQEGIISDKHNSSILKLNNDVSYFYGEFSNNLVPYGRSDRYVNNPKNVQVKKLTKER